MTVTRALTERQETRSRVRAVAASIIDPVTKNADAVIYKVPIGYELNVNRVDIQFGATSEDGNNLTTTNMPLVGVPSPSVQYIRSDTRIEWGAPFNPKTSLPGVPGIQTWDREEGPRLTSGEMFIVRFTNITLAALSGSSVTVTMEGTITEAGSTK